VTTPSAGPYAGLAHLGADLVSVADIAGIRAPHGVLVVPALGRACASATAAHQLVTLDAASYWVLAAPRLGSSPTGSPTTSPPARLFVSDESGEAEIVADSASGQRIGKFRSAATGVARL
jgi:hypothetical protein